MNTFITMAFITNVDEFQTLLNAFLYPRLGDVDRIDLNSVLLDSLVERERMMEERGGGGGREAEEEGGRRRRREGGGGGRRGGEGGERRGKQYN